MSTDNRIGIKKQTKHDACEGKSDFLEQLKRPKKMREKKNEFQLGITLPYHHAYIDLTVDFHMHVRLLLSLSYLCYDYQLSISFVKARNERINFFLFFPSITRKATKKKNSLMRATERDRTRKISLKQHRME